MTATPHHVSNSRQCPYCREWIVLPYRRSHEAWEAHKRRCRVPDHHAVDCDRGTITPETNEDDYECPGCGYQLGMTTCDRQTLDGATYVRYYRYCCEPCAIAEGSTQPLERRLPLRS